MQVEKWRKIKKMAEKYKLEFTSILEFDQFQIYIEKTCLLNGILLLIIIEMWRRGDRTVSNTFIAPSFYNRYEIITIGNCPLNQIKVKY